MRLNGKTVLISGAGRSNGKAVALAFAREGADLVLVARAANDVQQVAKECETLGAKALPLTAEVGKHEEVYRAVQLGLEQLGKFDVLVNVVGLRPHTPLAEVCYDECL